MRTGPRWRRQEERDLDDRPRLGPARPDRHRCRIGAGRNRSRRADPDQVLARLQVRGPLSAVRGGDRQGLLQGRRARRHHRYRGRLARTDQPRRLGHLRHGLWRHQLTDQVSRRQSGHADQGRVHGLQQAAVRHRRAQEPRRDGAEGSGRQEARRAAAGRRLRAMADLRTGEQHRCLQGQHRVGRLSGARADARERRGRRHHGLFVLLLHQPEGPRRTGRRHHGAADGGLWCQPLRQRHHGESRNSPPRSPKP